MSKQILHKKLVYFNFDKNEFRFYNVEVLSVGYNKIQVLTSHGSIGTKGREQMTRFEGSDDAFKKSLKFAYNKIYEKKNSDYVSFSKVKEAFSKAKFGKDKKKKKTEPTHMVYLHFDKNEFRFYNIEILSIGHNQLQVISSHGRLGTKGREQVSRFQNNENVFKEAIKFSESKIREKKQNGFITKEEAKKIYDSLLISENKSEKKEPTKPPEKRRISFGYDCDKCRKTIKPEMFEKINTWARGEGNWDNIPKLKDKIFCLNCQFDMDIFKKKLSPADFS